MLHSLVQKTSETHVVSAYPTVIPTTFRDVFGQLVHQLLSDGKICRRRLCFMVKSCVIHCFRLRFSHLNQSIDQLGTVSISKSEFFFQGDSGDSWPPLDAGLGQCFEGSWSVYLKTSENKRLFQAPRALSLKHLTAFDSVWLRLTAFDIASWL